MMNAQAEIKRNFTDNKNNGTAQKNNAWSVHSW